MDYTIMRTGTNLLRLQFPDMEITNNILSIIDDKYIKDIRIFWKSKYNSYVVYDYEPFCTEGFDVVADISFTGYSNMLFSKYLIEKFMSNIDKLEQSFNTNIDMRLKENKIIKDLQEV